MRSADQLFALIAVVALGGCATVSLDTPPVAPAPAAAAAAPAPAPVAPPAPPAVDPAAQRAFDEARRQLVAGRADLAQRGFEALTRSHPDLPGPHANLGLIARQAGRLDEAAQALETATRLGPRQPSYWNQLGITYRQQGRFVQAREAYERALDASEDYAPAVLNLGILHDLYLGNAAQALGLYERYLSLVPGGDAEVNKWVIDLKNRKPAPVAANQKEPR
jgi:tetratricopeptide (TPR) repeat protein